MATRRQDPNRWARVLRKLVDKALGRRRSYTPPPGFVTDVMLWPWAKTLAQRITDNHCPPEVWDLSALQDKVDLRLLGVSKKKLWSFEVTPYLVDRVREDVYAKLAAYMAVPPHMLVEPRHISYWPLARQRIKDAKV